MITTCLYFFFNIIFKFDSFKNLLEIVLDNWVMEGFSELNEPSFKIYKNTDKNLITSATKIQDDNEFVIFPTDYVYRLLANGFKLTSFRKFERFIRQPKEEKLTYCQPVAIGCLGTYDASLFVKLSLEEQNIFDILIKTYWPGPLIIFARASEIVPKHLLVDGKWIALCCPSNKFIRKVIQFSNGLPIIISYATHHNKPPSTTFEHIFNKFGSKKFHVYRQVQPPKKNNEGDNIRHNTGDNSIEDPSLPKMDHQEPTLIDNDTCKYCLEDTIVKITDQQISLVNNGFISKQQIETVLSNTGIKQIMKEQISNHFDWEKQLYVLNILDLSVHINSKHEFNEELREHTLKYLDKTVLFDFNGKLAKYENCFGVYVDLSKNGHIEEAIMNLYSVIHQILELRDKTIKLLVYDFSHGIFKTNSQKNLNLVFWNKIHQIANDRRLVIPVHFLSQNVQVMDSQIP